MTGDSSLTDGARTQRAFADVFDANATRLVRFAAFLGAEDAEDVVQETFRRLYARRGTFRGDVQQASAYLNRTVLNLVRDRGRRHVRTVRVLRLHQREAEQVIPSVEALALASDCHRSDNVRSTVTMTFWQDPRQPALSRANPQPAPAVDACGRSSEAVGPLVRGPDRPRTAGRKREAGGHSGVATIGRSRLARALPPTTYRALIHIG